jgi:hypothetical protein
MFQQITYKKQLMKLTLIIKDFGNNLKNCYLILKENLNKLLKKVVLNFYKTLLIVLKVLDLKMRNQTCIKVLDYYLKNNKKIKKIKNLQLIKILILFFFKIFE